MVNDISVIPSLRLPNPHPSSPLDRLIQFRHLPVSLPDRPKNIFEYQTEHNAADGKG